MKRFGSTRIFAAAIAIVCIAGVWEANAYDRLSNRENMVRVDVLPVQLEAGKAAKFEIRMNTHSQDLGQDLVTVSTLKDDSGREYRAVQWEGSLPGGHHRSGVLAFPVLEGNAKSVSLMIRDVADVPQRVFTWDLK